MIHPLADCKNNNIPQSTNIWQFCVVFEHCKIGENCNICAGVIIENDVQIGDNVTIKNGVQLWNGVRLEDNVFIDPNATFTNDIYPRSKQYPKQFAKTIIKKVASLGANSTIAIVAGVSIGENAMIGAGSVITRDVPANTLWYGEKAMQRKELQLISNKITRGGIIRYYHPYSLVA
ncbi:MAG: N-acetyltransferase [Clostridia bacterium]|nr:N-acetyltransferase [Clostridia bacterium]